MKNKVRESVPYCQVWHGVCNIILYKHFIIMEVIDALIAIDKFVTENNNFECVEYHNKYTDSYVVVPRFIVECKWGCNTEHIIDKWMGIIHSCDCYGFLIKFYCGLDDKNREVLVEWLIKNRSSRYERKEYDKY